MINDGVQMSPKAYFRSELTHAKKKESSTFLEIRESNAFHKKN